jgi:lipopolysaccharide export system protein LptC
MSEAVLARIPSARLIKPRFHQSYRLAKRRTAAVIAARRFLLAGLIFIVGGYALMIGLAQIGSQRSSSESASAEAERMVNPRFTGADKTGTPYTITANAATRNQDDVVRTFLESPFVQYYTREKALQEIIANDGVYNREERTLLMSGSVKFKTDDGYSFTSEAAILHIDESRIRGDMPISGSGPMGTIKAGGFEMLDNGARVRFINGVEARISQRHRNPPEEGDEMSEGAGLRR